MKNEDYLAFMFFYFSLFGLRDKMNLSEYLKSETYLSLSVSFENSTFPTKAKPLSSGKLCSTKRLNRHKEFYSKNNTILHIVNLFLQKWTLPCERVRRTDGRGYISLIKKEYYHIVVYSLISFESSAFLNIEF
jgi:hypothetical protein